MATLNHQCPVCGFLGLDDPPRSSVTGGASYEICISCGFQFGFSDDSEGYDYAGWRAEWVKRGMQWASVGQAPPIDWNPRENLRVLLGSDEKLFCRVCGFRSEKPTWGEDGQSPNFEFCPCCGVHHGYEDATDIAAKNFRKKWIAAGANWDDIRSKPEGWSLETQLQNVPESFKS